jgi:hypothetical protein
MGFDDGVDMSKEGYGCGDGYYWYSIHKVGPEG